MTPGEARKRVLAQHEVLRVLMSSAEGLARRFVAGETVARELDAVLEELRAAWAEHNRYEETVLAPLLRTSDGFGGRRVDRMREEHVEEHRVITELLSGRLPAIAPGLSGIFEELLAHMEAEERTFLDPRSLAKA